MIHHCYVVPPPPPPPPAAALEPVVETAARGLRRAGAASLVGLSALALLLSLAVSLGAQTPAATRPAAADTSAGRNYGWLGDRRTFVVGDIVRVAIDEYALATANKGTVNSASRRRKMDMGLEPPSVGAASGAIDGTLQTGDAGESRQRGEATRGTRYVGELAARVVAVTPEGLLQIKGSKVIDVDKNKQTLTLTGFVRPQDISSRDAVASTAVADAQLAYASAGGLGKPRNGILTKIVGILWP